jgi:hypothetical protein
MLISGSFITLNLPAIWPLAPGPIPVCRTCLAWIALPGTYAPASIDFPVIAARMRALNDKAIVLGEGSLPYK